MKNFRLCHLTSWNININKVVDRLDIWYNYVGSSDYNDSGPTDSENPKIKTWKYKNQSHSYWNIKKQNKGLLANYQWK